jgi:hypothetical protein
MALKPVDYNPFVPTPSGSLTPVASNPFEVDADAPKMLPDDMPDNSDVESMRGSYSGRPSMSPKPATNLEELRTAWPWGAKATEFLDKVNSANLAGMREGALFGFGDEVAAALNSGDGDFEQYRQKAEAERLALKEESPIAYGVGNVEGIIGGGVMAVPKLLGLGARALAPVVKPFIPKAVSKASAEYAAWKAAKANASNAGKLARWGAEFGEGAAQAGSVGAGYAAAQAGGEAEPGGRTKAAVDAAPTGAAIGAGLYGGLRGVMGGLKFGSYLTDLASKFGIGRSAASRFQEQFPKGLDFEGQPGNPQYKPLPETPGAVSDAKRIADELNPHTGPSEVDLRIAENTAAVAATPRPAGEIARPGQVVVSNFNKSQQEAAAINAQNEAVFNQQKLAAQQAAEKKAADEATAAKVELDKVATGKGEYRFGF